MCNKERYLNLPFEAHFESPILDTCNIYWTIELTYLFSPCVAIPFCGIVPTRPKPSEAVAVTAAVTR